MKLKRFSLFFSLLFVVCNASAWTERNMLVVNIVDDDSILFKGCLVQVDEIKDLVKNYVGNPHEDWEYAEKVYREIDLLGEVAVSKAVVSVQTSRTVSYFRYLAVNNEIEKAFRELREESAFTYFKKNYKALSPAQKKAINQCVPKRISEAEPVFVREGKHLVRNSSYWWYY